MTTRLRVFPLAAKPRAPKGRTDAFTLVELLIGAALSVIVVSSLAAVALIAELRMGRDAEVNQSLRDHWGRTLAFINNEAQQAYWIRTTTTAWPCGGEGVPEGPLLVLEGPPNPATNGSPSWTVAYGVRANGSSKEWRGFNRLVRCGPPFIANARGSETPEDPEERRAEALAGNLDYTANPTESVIADQLAQTGPFQTRLDDSSLQRSRDAEVSLFMSRRTGLSYPPAKTLGTAFHTQLRANRNPGFDVTGNPACNTTTIDGSEEPNLSGSCPLLPLKDSLGRRTFIKEYNLPASGTLKVNGCGQDCRGPRSTSTTDVVFLKGNIADFTKQFAAPGKPNATDACSRASCFVSNGKQNVQIYDGNVLVFYDGLVRL